MESGFRPGGAGQRGALRLALTMAGAVASAPVPVPLEPLTTYELMLEPGAVEDLAGNPHGGLASGRHALGVSAGTSAGGGAQLWEIPIARPLVSDGGWEDMRAVG